MGKYTWRETDFWLHLLADLVVRVAYFVGTAFILVFGASRRPHVSHWHWYSDHFREYAAVVIAVSTLAAIFGPWLYRTATERGRGTLRRVKRESEEDYRR